MIHIGRIEKLDIRDVWPHEAHDFTRWLYENLDELGDAIGIESSGTHREASTGSFSLDVLAEDPSGDIVVVENQFGNSDHDHLGKLLTYLASFDAVAAVWIVEDARAEHVAAITWLNESAASAEFFLVQIEVVRIEDSPPAPRFTVIAQPSEEMRKVGFERREIADRHIQRREFWSALLDESRKRHRLHGAVAPNTSPYLLGSSGVPGLSFNYCALEDHMRVELYISRGDEESSDQAFEALERHRREIDDAFGQPLVWQRLPGRKSCRIKQELPGGSYRDAKRWNEIIEGAVDAMVKLESAIRPHLASIR